MVVPPIGNCVHTCGARACTWDRQSAGCPVTTSWRSEDPTLLHGKANGQQPHQWALALPKSQRDTPSNWCHGFGRTVTLQTEVNFEGGLLWIQHTSGVAATHTVRPGQLVFG